MFSHLVMTRHHFQRLLIPDPIFEHLTRSLDEVPLDGRSGESDGLGFCADAVHHVAELVEEGLDLVVVQQGRLRLRRLREVRQHCADSQLKEKGRIRSREEPKPNLYKLN